MPDLPTPDAPPSRPPCPKPADFRREVADYDRRATVGRLDGPRHRMTYRTLGVGPPLLLCPGIAGTYRGYAPMLNRLSERFRTVLFDYPGDLRDDRARLRGITHDDLVSDVFALMEHLNIGRAFLAGLSFGSTIVLRTLHREPRRFPRAAVQGAFARRVFTRAERLALRFGRLMPGTVDRLPLRRRVLSWNSRLSFPDGIADRWGYYVEQNGLTPIGPLAHRLDLLAGLDLRPILPGIPTEILVLQGNEDRIVPRAYYDELLRLLPKAQGALLPMVGHQPHYTHFEALAQAIGEYFMPCRPEGCERDASAVDNPGDVGRAAEQGGQDPIAGDAGSQRPDQRGPLVGRRRAPQERHEPLIDEPSPRLDAA
jgi:pimeloyl-ACP methyl ester carboxylesterase